MNCLSCRVTDSIEGAKIAKLYPNPVHEVATLKVSALNSEKMEYQLIDAVGKLLAHKLIWIIPGNNIVTIKSENLSPGFYTLKLKSAQTNQSIKFIKK